MKELTIFRKWKILIGSPYFFSGIIASIIMLFIWLALVKHFFDIGWLIALAISVIAIIICIVIVIIIGLIVGTANRRRNPNLALKNKKIPSVFLCLNSNTKI